MSADGLDLDASVMAAPAPAPADDPEPAGGTPLLAVEGVSKTFTLHRQGGAELPVVRGATFQVFPGECVALGGASGAGKTTLLKMIYGTYRIDEGRALVRDGDGTADVARATPRAVLALRRQRIVYVSQFLRVILRVSALDVVAEPLIAAGVPVAAARQRAGALLARLNLSERLWPVPPATFSGGEQQRVNIARALMGDPPVLLLDEPTAALDGTNRAQVIALLQERKRAGAGLLGIFHDAETREALADRVVDVTHFAP